MDRMPARTDKTKLKGITGFQEEVTVGVSPWLLSLEDKLGDPRLSCRLRLMPTGRKELPKFEVQTEREGTRQTLEGKETSEGHVEYQLFGDRAVTIRWTKSQPKPSRANGAKKKRKETRNDTSSES